MTGYSIITRVWAVLLPRYGCQDSRTWQCCGSHVRNAYQGCARAQIVEVRYLKFRFKYTAWSMYILLVIIARMCLITYLISSHPLKDSQNFMLPVIHLNRYDEAYDCKTNITSSSNTHCTLHLNGVGGLPGRKGPEESCPCDDFLDSDSTTVPLCQA